MARLRTKFKTDEDTRVDLIKQVAYCYARPNKAGEIQGAKQLSKKFGVPVVTIQSWANQLRAMGVDVPRMTKLGIYTRVFSEIKRERPQAIIKKDAKRG